MPVTYADAELLRIEPKNAIYFSQNRCNICIKERSLAWAFDNEWCTSGMAASTLIVWRSTVVFKFEEC